MPRRQATAVVRATHGTTLFDLADLKEGKECQHLREVETDTDWGPPYGVRMTATCLDCGNVRGRAGKLR